MTPIKPAKIHFRSLFFIHRSTFIFLKKKYVYIAPEQTEDMLSMLSLFFFFFFASSLQTMWKNKQTNKQRHGTYNFENSSLRKHLTDDGIWRLGFLGCQFWFSSSVLSIQSYSLSEGSSTKHNSINTTKPMLALGQNHIAHTRVCLTSW